MDAVLVTHPGRQHSHQAALALSQVEALAGYWSGVPSVARHFDMIPSALRGAVGRYPPVSLPEDRVRWMPWTPARRRIGDRLLPKALAAWNDLAACRSFDRWVQRRLESAPSAAVIACEISARRTFVAARALGRMTILDAPSFHHRTQDRLTGVHESARLHRRIARIKDDEIALADHIFTVSDLARDSYLDAGIEPSRVHALDLGADLSLFEPPAHPPGSGEVTFLFCGAMLHRKGFDVLADAFSKLGDARACWRIAGPPGDATGALRSLAKGAPGIRIEVLGAVPQRSLVAEMQRADCLLLPSRHDSYGMVVAEALACGLPVLISRNVGARHLVAEGSSGWIVPPEDAAALAERLRWCIDHPASLRGMRPAARTAAEEATWPAYHRRLVSLLASLLERRSA